MIHQYILNGYHIVLDINSGSVHFTDPVAYDMIAMYEKNSREEIIASILSKYAAEGLTAADAAECFADIEELKRDGKLFSSADYMSLTDGRPKDDSIKALCLHVAHTCNLNCEYCFASQGKYNGERALMSYDVGRQALDYLIASSGKHVNLEVDFFGGEPLMNLDVVKKLVAYARGIEKERGKHFRFTLTTNGMLLDDAADDFLNAEMDNVVLSLDGRKEIHDAKRRDYAGNGSYDKIVPKFQRLVAGRGDKSYYVRGTFTSANTDFANDIFHMADLGFKELSMEPVVSAPQEPYAIGEKDLPVLFEQYEILACEMLKRARSGNGFTFYHYMIDLKGGPCIYKRLSGCGSGSEYMAVTPDGTLYPCHQFVGDEKFIMGDIWHGVTDTALREEFKNCDLCAHAECRDCWARYYCAGGCAANAYHATGSIGGVYKLGCELFKKRIECAIMLQAALQSDAAAGK